MNTDIRIQISFSGHVKRKKLQSRLKSDGVLALIDLWLYAGENHPDGALRGMTVEDIGLAVNWKGDPEKFISNLVEIGFLECIEGVYILHDWDDHNPYAVHAPDRKERAKIAASVKWGTPLQRKNKKNRAERMKEARKKGNHAECEWQEMKEYFGTCVKCGGESGLDHIDRDHIIPVYQDGCHSIRNIQPLCAKCNASKGPESIDHRLEYCKKNNIEMPAKWRRDACKNYDCCMHDACTKQASNNTTHALTSTPSPSPSPSPSPNPDSKFGDESPPARKFVKPTLEQVKAYCLERKNNVNAQKWVDHYKSNGWKVGKNPMKDWKAAVRKWEADDGGGNGSSPPKQNNESPYEVCTSCGAEVLKGQFIESNGKKLCPKCPENREVALFEKQNAKEIIPDTVSDTEKRKAFLASLKAAMDETRSRYPDPYEQQEIYKFVEGNIRNKHPDAVLHSVKALMMAPEKVTDIRKYLDATIAIEGRKINAANEERRNEYSGGMADFMKAFSRMLKSIPEART